MISQKSRVRFSIRNKLIVGFSLTLLILIITILITLIESRDVSRFYAHLKNESLPTANAIQHVNQSIYDSEATAMIALVTHNEKYT